jgi:penicillin-binding protein 1B
LAVKLRRSLFVRFLLNPWGKACLAVAALSLIAGVGTLSYFYVKYSRMTDQALKNGPFTNSSLLYASPRPVAVGDEARSAEIATYLRRCQYSESNTSRAGWFRVRPDGIEINPGPDAYDQEGAVIKIEGGRVASILSLADHTERTEYFLEPELITNLFDRQRKKRRPVHFDEIPKVMIDAVRAAEDEHFFEHAGFDPIGIVRSGVNDIFYGKRQGASTLTQQLAGMLLFPDMPRGMKRKFLEIFPTLHLEQSSTKQQIFEYYANNVYLGNQGSFSINGFGEGAQVYFGKDLGDLTLPEASLMAGLIQSQHLWDPYRHPEAAKTRRNIVLKNMRKNDYITERAYQEAAASPLVVNKRKVDSAEAPYFVDLTDNELQNRFQDQDFQHNSFRVYTTLDMDLQRDAEEAAHMISETDTQWKRRNKKYGTDEFPVAQLCIVALDAQTGEIKALVGGRAYGTSQLDHCLAQRQPGSSFKPFVYAAAMETGLDFNAPVVLTPASTVDDEPTTFWFEQQPPYTPADFKDEYDGKLTLREALQMSKNVPAVKIAEMVHYERVADLARRVGLNGGIKPTPSIALGAYEVMPLEIARAYTVFPNGGDLLETGFIKSIRDQRGSGVFTEQLKRKPALDPRVAYLVENMLEDVLRGRGTGAGARSRGFTLPAAGKTGTSRDGWFAGFTSKVICIVWVGFDDNRDFKLEGAHSALPIWVDFMKRAHQHSAYHNVHEFEPPDGIVTAEIDADTGELASPFCPHIRSEVFIAGTQPVQICHLHGKGGTQVAGWEPIQPPQSQDSRTPVVAASRSADKSQRSIPVAPAPQPPPAPRKKGFLGWIKEHF